MTDQPRKRVTIDAPDSATILAARHLDATEGPVQVGAIVDADTRSAITTVLRYITKAHNAPSCPDPIECGHEAALGEAQEAARRALAQRQEMAAERDQARETNRRLNQRAQQLESELAAYRRAVAQWEASERRTYVPLRTIAAIAKAAGRDIENPQWMLHYRRVEQAEAAITRIIALADRWKRSGTRDLARYADIMLAALDDPKPTIPADETVEQTDTQTREWCKCPSCWGWFVEDHPGEDLDELGKDLGWWSGLPEHRDAPAAVAESGKEAWAVGSGPWPLLANREEPDAEAQQQADAQTLAALFEGFGRLLASSSRDWGVYAPDAWLWAVILGWDCEETEHDETCTHGAMEEMQRRHGWSDEAVVKTRRYRAAVKARRAKERQLDGIRRALCDIGFMQDDDPYSHADLEDVIRQAGRLDEVKAYAAKAGAEEPPQPTKAERLAETVAMCQAIVNRVREAVATDAPAPPSEAERCCVCGGAPVTYHNYREQPFCWPCADCQCNQDVCVRTGINDPAVSETAALRVRAETPAGEQYRYATTWAEYHAGRKAAAPPADGEAREPCPHCPDSATYPRRLMDVHLAAEHPDVRAPELLDAMMRSETAQPQADDERDEEQP